MKEVKRLKKHDGIVEKLGLKFNVGDKVRINVSENELESCVRDFRIWLKENKFIGVIDDIVDNPGYPYWIDGHDFPEHELELYTETKFYRLKSHSVEAVLWKGDNLDEVKAFVGDVLDVKEYKDAWDLMSGEFLATDLSKMIPDNPQPVAIYSLSLVTLDSRQKVYEGDWIIRYNDGRYAVCPGTQFVELYEKVD